MSHRKVHSLGNVPFSWEEEPGVCKVSHQKRPTDIGLYGLDHLSRPPSAPTSPPCHSNSAKVPVPLPPCPSKPPRRSTSLKGLWRQEDPFLAAYKECTKNEKLGKSPSESKRGSVGFNVRFSKFGFSCKKPGHVREDNLVKLTHLPPLPRERNRGLR
ncbi:hypothetical protein L1049_023865 [Liquidambar formosana]|uniref:Uncharacterized protein n=1 Tax=Liquidambar formosana TaxID=63359 RepID=A0AAP0S091_LIQFO